MEWIVLLLAAALGAVLTLLGLRRRSPARPPDDPQMDPDQPQPVDIARERLSAVHNARAEEVTADLERPDPEQSAADRFNRRR